MDGALVCKSAQDADYSENSAYASYFNGGTLEISAYKNEYEAAQILLTPEADVKNYDIALSDLKCGEETLGAENFTVYNQKYVNINRPSASHSNSVLGMTPDALLPFAAAEKVRRNEYCGGRKSGDRSGMSYAENAEKRRLHGKIHRFGGRERLRRACFRYRTRYDSAR